MKKYEIDFETVEVSRVEVEANNEEEAREKAIEAFNLGDIQCYAVDDPEIVEVTEI